MKQIRASRSITAALMWGRSPHSNVGTNLKAMFLKDGGNLIDVGNGALEFHGPEGRTLSFYYGGWGYGTGLAFLRHYVEFKFAWFVCYGDL